MEGFVTVLGSGEMAVELAIKVSELGLMAKAVGDGLAGQTMARPEFAISHSN